MADTYKMQNLILELAVAKDLEAEGLRLENTLSNDVLPGDVVPNDIAPLVFTSNLPSERHSIVSILTYWCESLKSKVKPSTYSSYTYQVEHALIPYLGSRVAEEFQEQSMAEFLEKYREESGKNTTEPSESTLYLLEVILRRAFLYAVNQGMLVENPLGKLQMRPCQDAEFTILPVEAVDAIKQRLSTKSALTRLEILLPLYTGCILSELCALSWREIDLEQNELYIRKNLFRVRETKPGSRAKTTLQLTELELGEQRTIHIPEILAKELYDMENRELLSNRGAYLLTGTNAHMDPRTYQKHVCATLAECGIENGSLTMLRDTYVVMCLECGAGEYSLARQLGIETARLITRYQDYLQPDYSFLQKLK